ncbi:MAG TPA: hypothetical protein VK137_08720, partial [Planctomycetaceae bacterium]|nr:hypothetical protein [Planctomycetaceae bacterium]
SSGGSSGSSGGSSGMMGSRVPMADAYLVPMATYQGYAPMSGQGMLMPDAGQSPMTGNSPMDGPPSIPSPPADSTTNAKATTQLTNFDGVPGTLGLTYQLPSKRIPADLHPRIGLIEITVSDKAFRSLVAGEEIKITVEDEAGNFPELEGYFGDDNKWHFESKPLYPGIPQIFDAKFEVVKTQMKRERKGDKMIEWEAETKVRDLGARRMRLIPGRTVFLNFP